MHERVTASQFLASGLTDWRFLLGRAEASFHCPGFAAAGKLVQQIAALADELGHHPVINLRHPDLVHVVTTAEQDRLTELDVELCRRVSALAAAAGASGAPTEVTTLEVAIDALDIDVVRPFWAAVLGYVDAPTEPGRQVDAVVDPRGIGPAFWFQQMITPRPERNRIHLDVTVAHDAAEARIAAALAAGGTLLSDRRARAFWVLADPEGNEACVCTWQDRGTQY